MFFFFFVLSNLQRNAELGELCNFVYKMKLFVPFTHKPYSKRLVYHTIDFVDCGLANRVDLTSGFQE